MKMAAEENLRALSNNPYPGRGLVVGLNDTGSNLVQVYWLTGRSPGSRNWVLTSEGGRVYTEQADPMLGAGNTQFTIYDAMNERNEWYVVSNGCQTDTVAESAAPWASFHSVMEDKSLSYEQDAPIHTPRITAISERRLGDPRVQISVLKKSIFGDACDRALYTFERLARGFGYCVTTYLGDGDPPPAFCGAPYPVPLTGGIGEILRTFWEVLDTKNRVALAVKFISMPTGLSMVRIVNENQKNL